MRQQLRLALHAALGSLTLAAGRGAAAQGWSPLPDGGVSYTANYTATGSFYCSGGFTAGSSCVASGNTLTLGSGGSFMTLTFTGTTQSITATNTRVPAAAFGTITKAFSGTGPFQFPTPSNSNVLTFGFALRVDETGPAVGAAVRRFGYIVPPTGTTALPVNCCGDDSGYSDFISLPATASPAPFRYGAVVFDHFTDLTLRADNVPITVAAQVGIVPEPATVVLTGAGLAVAGLAAARRRRA